MQHSFNAVCPLLSGFYLESLWSIPRAHGEAESGLHGSVAQINFHSTCLDNPVLLHSLCLPETLWWCSKRFSVQRGLVGTTRAPWSESYNKVTAMQRLKRGRAVTQRLHTLKKLLEQWIRWKVAFEEVLTNLFLLLWMIVGCTSWQVLFSSVWVTQGLGDACVHLAIICHLLLWCLWYIYKYKRTKNFFNSPAHPIQSLWYLTKCSVLSRTSDWTQRQQLVWPAAIRSW